MAMVNVPGSPSDTAPSSQHALAAWEAFWDATFVSVPQTATIGAAIAALGRQEHHSCVLVLADEALVGILTERDLIPLIAQQAAWDHPVQTVMRPQPMVLKAAEPPPVIEILKLMQAHLIHHLPVVDEGDRPLGLITAHTLQSSLPLTHLLKMQTVSASMTQTFVTVAATDAALPVAQRLAETQIGCAVVVDQPTLERPQHPLGVVRRHDLVRVQAQGFDLATLPVQTFMQELPLCLQPSDSLWLAHQEMQQRGGTCLLVVDTDDTLMGIIRQADILANLNVRDLSRSFSNLWQAFRQADTDQMGFLQNYSAELERLVRSRTEQLAEQAKGDRILTRLTQRIHASLDLEEILSMTASEICQLLQADRVFIWQGGDRSPGRMVVESVSESGVALQATPMPAPLADYWEQAFRHGRMQAIDNVQTTTIRPEHLQALEQVAIQANLMVPIVCDRQLWGLLVLNQCRHTRRWRYWEIRLLEQLAHSLAIGIRQSQLYQQLQAELAERKRFEAELQNLNNKLEQKVEERTRSWRQATAQLSCEVTFRSQAEAALRETNSQLQAMLDAVPGMVAWISAERVYLGCNQHLAAVFQRQPGEFVGQKLSFLPAAAPLNEFAADFFASDRETASKEIAIELHDTTQHYLIVTQKYNQGQVAVFVGIDISDREAAKAALQDSEAKFRNLVEYTNDWVWELDQQSRFVYVSPRASAITGYRGDELIGQRFSDLMRPDDAIRFDTILAHNMGAREAFTQIESTCLHKQGHSVVLEISGSPIFTPEGTLQGYRGTTRDITERKQVEINIRKALTKEKELSELKSRFISMASHEFRTPLTTILASAETLERYRHKLPEEKQKVILKRIQTSVNHVIALLSDVLTAGKAEAGKFAFNPAPLDLQQFCTDLVEELLVTQSPPITPIHFQAIGQTFEVAADEKLLRHVLINLLSNAVKYSPENHPVAFALTQTATEIQFQVSDRGIGIAPEDQAQLFEAFHRGNNVGNISGNGLGLMIAKRAVEAHQGTIMCTSQLNQGTTFTVVLPFIQVEKEHG